MRQISGVLLALLWMVLLVVYSLPLWFSRYASIDMHVSAVPPAPQWLAPVFVVIACALPPLVLAALTWLWFRRSLPHK